MNSNRNYQKKSKTTQYIKIGENINQSLYVKGIWESTFGKLVINQEGNKITGYYPWDDGIIYGQMDKNTLSGNWYEKPTGKPSADAGRLLFTFNKNEFIGKYGYGNKSLYYNWNGKKIHSILLGNCFRYQVSHNAPNISTIIVNGESIEYGQQSSYFYPEKCSQYVDLKLIVDGEIFEKNVSVEPGFSYTFSVENEIPNLEIDVIVDNPFR